LLKILLFGSICHVANLKSAIKKIRVDKRRTKVNSSWKTALKAALKKPNNVTKVYQIADKMVKRKIISPRKAARIKAHAARKP
jgi:ribosomal protein S20